MEPKGSLFSTHPVGRLILSFSLFALVLLFTYNQLVTDVRVFNGASRPLHQYIFKEMKRIFGVDLYREVPRVSSRHEFIKIDNSSLHVVSAYLDTSEIPNENVSRTLIPGIITKPTTESFMCSFFNRNIKYMFSSNAKLKFDPDKETKEETIGNEQYHQVILTCDGNIDAKYVIISTQGDNHNGYNQTAMPIKAVSFKGQDKVRSLGMCVTEPLLNLKDTDFNLLIEFIDFYRLTGVERIFIYGVHGCSQKITSLIEAYKHLGYVEVIPWRLPMTTPTNTTSEVRSLQASGLR